MTSRVILHVDMDAFYVSVELRRRPELRRKPVVVGGAGPRGVVAAASYEARRYGVRSAMPSSVVRRRCPHAVFLAGDHELYARVSAEVRNIFDRYTPVVEPLSLDEAFLDVTGSVRLFGDGAQIAASIRADVRAELELGCSVGVATNKLLAKLASVEAKPIAEPSGVRPGRGVVVVEPGLEREFLAPLPVGRLWGVGPVTLERLRTLGVATVGDLAAIEPRLLETALGQRAGAALAELARGDDLRPVQTDRELKSIGHEETFAHDLHEVDELRRELVKMSDAVAARLRARGVGARTLTLKVRYAEFRTITRSVTLREPVATAHQILGALAPFLDILDVAAGVRLLGVSGSNLGEPVEQLSLFDGAGDEHVRAAGAIDEIRGRFGHDVIGPASTMSQRPSDSDGGSRCGWASHVR